MSAFTAGQRRSIWTLALLSTAGYGALYYAQPLLAVAFEHLHGWTRAQTGLAFTLALLTTALLAPAVGRALDIGHGRRWLCLGAWLGSGAFLLLALTSSCPLFVLGWLLAGVAMSLTFYEAVFTVLGQQVAGPQRARATLSVTLVAGLASTVFVPLTAALLQGGGLKTALLGLAALLLLAGGLVWRTVPFTPSRLASRSRVSFTPDRLFVRLALALTLTRIVTVGVGLQLAPLLMSAGHRAGVAALLTGLMGLAALPGRVTFVPLLGRFGAPLLTRWLLVQLGIGAFLLHFPRSLPLAVLGIVLFGAANGALTLARSELLSQAYPPEQFGTVNGLLAWPVNLAQALTPLGMGLLFTLTGSYSWSLSLLMVSVGVGILMLQGATYRTSPQFRELPIEKLPSP